MTIWTCKGLVATLALMALSACEDGQGAALFGAPSASVSRTVKPLLQTKLATGEITLVAPRGFCIDRKSVRKQFAIMARCDTLGAPQAAADAPLAFITVSVHSADPSATLPEVEHLATASELTNITDPQIKNGQLIFRATGAAPIDGVSDTHWRGTARKGGQIIGVALYGTADGRALTGEGRRIVSTVLANTQGGS